MASPPLPVREAPAVAAPPMLIDSHCHLQDPRFDPDRAEVIERAQQAGVEACVVVGNDLESSRRAIELASAHDFLHATVGVHPHEVRHLTGEDYLRLEELARHPEVVAYGEIGLDYHYRFSPEEAQRNHFRRQIRLALALGLPLVLHTRTAFPDAFRILREEGAGSVGGVFHCFSGDGGAAREALDLGFHLSFSGILTFRNAGAIEEAARIAPADRILVETDSPYLAPVPHRGRRNEPAHVGLVAEGLARLRGISEAEAFLITSANCRRLFSRMGV